MGKIIKCNTEALMVRKSNMHILFLTDNFPPESNAPASRTYEHACEWVKVGHQVTIITCAPNFPKGRVFEGYKNKLWQTEDMEGIRVIRVGTYITSNEGFIKRILDYMSFMLSGFVAALFVRRVDIVIGTSPQFFTVCAAWAASSLKRRPFIFELRDIWPESVRAVGAMQSSKTLDMFEAIEMFLYRRASRIISVTHSFKDTLARRGINPEKIHVVTNGVDPARFSPMQKEPELLSSLRLEGKFVVGYIGTLGMAHALETLLETAAILKQTPEASDVRILLLGDGAEREKLIARARDMDVDNVVFLPSVPKTMVARYWSLLDVSVVHLRKTDLFKTVVPSKIFECMAMGLPILHGVEGESANIIEKSSAGLLFEPENPRELASQIIELQSNSSLRESLSKNGVLAIQSYDRKTLAQRMLSIFQSVSN
jgi:glycosyltransferase involved in cell wall biosynthesis